MTNEYWWWLERSQNSWWRQNKISPMNWAPECCRDQRLHPRLTFQPSVSGCGQTNSTSIMALHGHGTPNPHRATTSRQMMNGTRLWLFQKATSAASNTSYYYFATVWCGWAHPTPLPWMSENLAFFTIEGQTLRPAGRPQPVLRRVRRMLDPRRLAKLILLDPGHRWPPNSTANLTALGSVAPLPYPPPELLTKIHVYIFYFYFEHFWLS